MKVLIIDDQEVSVKGIYDFCKDRSWESKIVDFEKAYQTIYEFDPDVIILDWRGDADNSEAGKDILQKIWINGYRPIVIFSANEGNISIEEMLNKSKVLKILPKGDEKPMQDYLIEIKDFVVALSEFRQEMSGALIESMNVVECLKEMEGIEDDAVKYVLSNRASEYFQNMYSGSISPSWVQYTCPPICDNLCVCDILRIRVNGEDFHDGIGDPREYIIILTPSCDMVCTDGRTPKVSNVLCAHCVSKEEFHSYELKPAPKKDDIDKVIKHLNAGYLEKHVPIPMFPGLIPYMTVNLKALELIPFQDIALHINECGDGKKYVRVASICSPYREQIVWAHMHDACRPGVPDRNIEQWAKEILTK